jgi:hypothetical protein
MPYIGQCEFDSAYSCPILEVVGKCSRKEKIYDAPEKYQIVLKVMKRDVEVDVPHESMGPHGHWSLNELLDKWVDIRKNMQGLLENIDTDDPQNMVYHHPYAGPLNIMETLEFINDHFDNHVRHVDVILAQVQ